MDGLGDAAQRLFVGREDNHSTRKTSLSVHGEENPGQLRIESSTFDRAGITVHVLPGGEFAHLRTAT
jgi:hypothetical protein